MYFSKGGYTMKNTWTYKKIWNRIIGMLLVLTMTVPGGPALMAVAATETVYEDTGTAASDLTNSADTALTDLDALTGQVEEPDLTAPEDVPEGIQNRKIGDYSAKDDYQSRYDITYYTDDSLPDINEPLYAGTGYSTPVRLSHQSCLPQQ